MRGTRAQASDCKFSRMLGEGPRVNAVRSGPMLHWPLRGLFLFLSSCLPSQLRQLNMLDLLHTFYIVLHTITYHKPCACQAYSPKVPCIRNVARVNHTGVRPRSSSASFGLHPSRALELCGKFDILVTLMIHQNLFVSIIIIQYNINLSPAIIPFFSYRPVRSHGRNKGSRISRSISSVRRCSETSTP